MSEQKHYLEWRNVDEEDVCGHDYPFHMMVLPPEIREAKTGMLLKCSSCDQEPATETGMCPECTKNKAASFADQPRARRDLRLRKDAK